MKNIRLLLGIGTINKPVVPYFWIVVAIIASSLAGPENGGTVLMWGFGWFGVVLLYNVVLLLISYDRERKKGKG
jgi:hypothetical protein